MNPTKKFREFFAGLSDLVRSRDPIIETMHVSAALRDADWARVSAMAGLTPEGAIAPPPPGTAISREPVQWRKAYPPMVAIIDEHQPIDLRPGAINYARVYRDLDDKAMCEVEGRRGHGRPDFIY